ncbi:hypothetical protein YC2023_033747 [Brassica napus]
MLMADQVPMQKERIERRNYASKRLIVCYTTYDIRGHLKKEIVEFMVVSLFDFFVTLPLLSFNVVIKCVAYGALAHVFNDLWNSIDAYIVLCVLHRLKKVTNIDGFSKIVFDPTGVLEIDALRLSLLPQEIENSKTPNREIDSGDREIPTRDRFRRERSIPSREIDSGERDRFRRERFDPSREFRRLQPFSPARFDYSGDIDVRRDLAKTTSSIESISLHERNKRRTQLSPMIMSNMIQPRGGNSNHDLPIAGTSNPRETGTQKSPLIMSNMIQTQDEISSTHDSPIAGSSNVFERGTKTHAETEWNSIQRVDEVSGIQHTCISDSLISPSSGLVSNKQRFKVQTKIYFPHHEGLRDKPKDVPH